ncbi:hypothetical protein A3E97_05135 [Candidatus Uhrbacteria bacterium RIFCSPHIGHO2_12_FULL_47_12]|nr:MAG: hypothetical protein A3E97_05135 [Candidatus Uhrbacteria bacterium RIFCSPHIGHO2_12_FULL_47_12]
MRDVFEKMEEEISVDKRASAERLFSALQDLILLRYQAFITISAIGFAIAGVVLTVRSEMIENKILAVIAVAGLVVISLLGFGRCLYIIRKDIGGIARRLKDLPKKKWGQLQAKPEFSADWWPESLFALLILLLILFAFSFF